MSKTSSSSLEPPHEGKLTFDDHSILHHDINDSPSGPRDRISWVNAVVLSLAYFLALLEMHIISTPLPTIINKLHGSEFIWVGSAYSIAATAFMPIASSLSEVFGRRIVLIGSLSMYALGSIVGGVAHDINMLIAGRAIQGAGGAGLLSIPVIILSDVVAYKKRWLFDGILQLTWCVAAGIGPVVGGALAEGGNWRWVFFMNLPITGFAIFLSIIFLKLEKAGGDGMEKFKTMDWIGNVIVTASSVSIAIAVTWAGILVPWTSVRVLVPLVLGGVGLAGFLVYEIKIAADPLIPRIVVSNMTSISGLIQIFLLQIPFIGVVYYLPVYLQACKGSSPLKSGVDLLPLVLFVAPVAAFAMFTVTFSGRYRPQSWLGWIVIVIAMGHFTLLKVETRPHVVVSFEIMAGIGFGIISATTIFPVLASLPATSASSARAFIIALRQYSQIWSVIIGGAIFQNALREKLPVAFTNEIGDISMFFQAIIDLDKVQEPLLGEIRIAFAGALRNTWVAFVSIGGIGFISSLFMRGLPVGTREVRFGDVEMGTLRSRIRQVANYARASFSGKGKVAREQGES